MSCSRRDASRLTVIAALACAACSSPPPPPKGACDGGTCAPATTSCDAGTYRDANGACQPTGWSDCPQGFAPDPRGFACLPIIAASCPAGTAPRLGDTGCHPAGGSTCDAGFAPHDSGWGCDAVLGSGCTGATREALGSTACVPIGDCATPGFPPAAATIFVDDSYPTVDATHFRSIGAALAAAPSGATIAIEPGTYAEALAPPRPVTLVGRCAAQVTITAAGTTPALLVATPLDVQLEGVTLTNGLVGIRAEGGARITARHVVLDANRRSGVQAVDSATRVTFEDAVVRGTVPDPATNSFGQGVAASFGAQLTFTDVTLTGNRENGIFLDRAATRLVGERVVVSGTLPRMSTGRLGWGVGVQGGAGLELTDAALVDNQATGLLVSQPDSRAVLTNAVIARTRPGLDNGDIPIAFGAAAQAGGALVLTNVALAGLAHLGVSVKGAGSSGVLTRVVVRDLVPRLEPSRAIELSSGSTLTLDDVAFAHIATAGFDAFGGEATLTDVVFFDLLGPGVRAQTGARVAAANVWVDGAAGAGIAALTDATVNVSGCRVRDTGLAETVDAGVVGYGGLAQLGGALTVDRCIFEASRAAGLYSKGGALTATSVIVRDTLALPSGDFGQGAVVEGAGSLSLTGALLELNRVSGLQVSDPGSRLAATAVTVRDTQPLPDGTRGRGANVQSGGVFTATQCALIDNRQVGVFTFRAKATLERVLVRGTLADPGGAYGNGVESLGDADLAMTGGALEGSAGTAAVFAEASGLLDGVRVFKNAVGLHLQDGALLLEVQAAPATRGPRDVAVTTSTAFDENMTTLGTGQVAVPAP
ncbi:MAG: hypothetical protein JNK82_16535 [Myxococcaceae bacterium]|nr:hypothetical protein [Myxococcaceae bacterium]